MLDNDEEEDAVPKGVYPRKATTGEEATPAPERTTRKRAAVKRKVTRRPRVLNDGPTPARFGVFEDGSVQIQTDACKGRLAPKEANALVEFIGRLRGSTK